MFALQKRKISQRKNSFFSGFKNKTTSRNRRKSSGWRFVFGTLLILLIFFVFLPLDLIISSIKAIGGGTEIINLYPSFYSSENENESFESGWWNLEKLNGTAELLSNDSLLKFSDETSAFYSGGNASLFLGEFMFLKDEDEILNNIPVQVEIIDSTIEAEDQLIIDDEPENVEVIEEEDIGEESFDIKADDAEEEELEIQVDKQAEEVIKYTIEIYEENILVDVVVDEEIIEPIVEVEIIENKEIELEVEIESVEEADIIETPISFFDYFKKYIGALSARAQEAGKKILGLNNLGEFKQATINFSFAMSSLSSLDDDISSVAEVSSFAEAMADKMADKTADAEDKIVIWYSLSKIASGTKDIIWHKLDTLSAEQMSNSLNNGYFRYEAPFLESWENVEDLQIKFEGLANDDTLFTAYLDSFWIEAEYEPSKTAEDAYLQIASDLSSVSTSTGIMHSGWLDPGYAKDNGINFYAARNISKKTGAAGEPDYYIRSTANTSEDLGGDITGVKIGFEGKVESTVISAFVQPIFNGNVEGIGIKIAGGNIGTIDDNQPDYIDITNDTARPLYPAAWTWQEIKDLHVNIWARNSSNSTDNFLYIDQIYIQVQYTPNTAPAAPGALSEWGTTTKDSIDLAFGAASSDINFAEYIIYYSTSSPVTESDYALSSSTDANLGNINFNDVATTSASGLLENTTYYFSIYAYDFFGHVSGSSEVNITTNKTPDSQINSTETGQKDDGSGTVDISIDVRDFNSNISTAKIEYEAGDTCAFLSSGDPSLDTNISGSGGVPSIDNAKEYQIRNITTSATNTLQFDWFSAVDVDGANDTYCFRLTVHDGRDNQNVSAFATTTIDNFDPSAPGVLSEGIISTSTIQLIFGATTTETNFSKYRIFYKAGTGGVTEGESGEDEVIDFDLDYKLYNNTSSTTVGNLNPDTEYVFNIWAYDLYGNKASSTEVVIKTESSVTNDSLTFENPEASNYIIADGLSEWNFQATISEENGWTTLDTVKLRLADKEDDISPFSNLEFTWSQSSNSFSETGADNNSAVIISDSSTSTCAVNTCTLDFNLIFNYDFASSSYDYSATLLSANDSASTDENTYPDIYQVKILKVKQIHYRWRNDDGGE
ncbi:hypothetical protein KAJ61_00110 [Candidatus Parcubacteria bacterium]|nr:hypothetical protein [Candidatus Parcubacteria bacterium]